MTLRTKLAARFALLSFFISVVLGTTLYFYFRAQIRQQLKQHLRDVVSLTAARIPGDEHALIQPGDDQESTAYSDIVSTFQGVQVTGSTIADIYTMRSNPDGEIIFVIDTDEEEPAAVGQVYTDPGPVLSASFATMNEPKVEEDFYTDQWGTWLSGYAPIYHSNGDREAVLAIDISAGNVIVREHQLLWIAMFIAITVTAVATGLGWWWANRISQPVRQMVTMAASIADNDLTSLAKGMAGIAQGDLNQTLTISTLPLHVTNADEIGQLGKSFNQMLNRLQEIGVAFAKMSSDLRILVGKISDQAQAVNQAAHSLEITANQAGRATNQVTTTIQQVARGAIQQAEFINHTANSVEQMSHMIDDVAKGAQEQAYSVGQSSAVLNQLSEAVKGIQEGALEQIQGMQHATIQGARLNHALQQVHTITKAVSVQAEEVAKTATDGTRLATQSVQGIQRARATTEQLSQHVRDLGKRSGQISTIVETIDDIAGQTNLLALNAAIEAARVESQGEKTVENILQRHMLGAVSLIAEFLATGHELESKDLVTLANRARVENLSISDPDGVIVAANDPNSLGFRFSEDPRHQSSACRPLLSQRDGIVIQPIMARDQDGKPFVYVAVSRRDRPGIVQAGTSAEVVYRLGGYSRGFAVVAGEVRKLAERSAGATNEIAHMIRTVQTGATEVVAAMNKAGKEVASAVQLTEEAGTSFQAIAARAQASATDMHDAHQAVTAMQAASEELEKAVADARVIAERNQSAAGTMSSLNEKLVNRLDSLSAVVEENTAATEEMATTSREVTQAIENIASVSEENSAAVEEISAATTEMNTQVEAVTAAAQSLAEMSQDLQQVLSRFKLSDEQLLVKKETPVQKPSLRQPNLIHSVHGNNGHAPVRVP